jgi:glycyl-tRNA synthetase
VRQFNLMFSTEIGSTAGATNKIYLRPETAQGIFVNFLNVQRTTRQKLPFGIAQIGKAFRNEIVARQFVFRMREFEQMEMQFFCQPGTEMKWFEYWKKARLAWHEALGMGDENYRFHDHEKLAFYANAATDIEFKMPFGFKEVEGIHSRTNYDLSQHEKFSGTKMRYFDPDTNESYVPYDVETSIGVDRMFLSVMCHSYRGSRSSRMVRHVSCCSCRLPWLLSSAPCCRLSTRTDCPRRHRRCQDDLKFHFTTHIEAKDSIGKRYRREDAIGTPYCVTVDGQTLEDNTVTLRHRDTMEQERVPVNELRAIIEDRVSITSVLKKLSKEIEGLDK